MSDNGLENFDNIPNQSASHVKSNEKQNSVSATSEIQDEKGESEAECPPAPRLQSRRPSVVAAQQQAQISQDFLNQLRSFVDGLMEGQMNRTQCSDHIN